ncbi:hypothetical protein [Streptomyces olivaceoviridis]|uniref:hypothetical protein n=1 Tax=Streptomyces olivaceoviridis TaxID=1921 RepID=UPI0036B08E10
MEPLVYRDETEEIGGRVYPPTMRIRMRESGDVVALDAIATMCAVAEGRITGVEARTVSALIAGAEENAGLQPRDEMDVDEFVASHTRLFQGGFIGYDQRGGYLSARAADPAALATLTGS